MTDTLFCRTCQKSKSKEDFSPSEQKNNSPRCRECLREKNRKYHQDNKEEISERRKKQRLENPEEIKKKDRQRYQDNKEAMKAISRRYNENNKEEISERRKQHREENIEEERKKDRKRESSPARREKKKQYRIENRDNSKKYREDNKDRRNKIRNERNKERRKEDPFFVLRTNVSRRISHALKLAGSSKKGKSCLDYLGYSIEDLWQHLLTHLEKEEWMTKDNYGKYNSETWKDNNTSTWTWNIDHIIPQSDLPYASMEDENFKKCWSLENLRPYSAKQNCIDGVNRTRHAKKC